jgi:hypothetical protein
MAYLRELSPHRCRCGARAVVQVFNALNAPLGEFCRSCGKRELARLRAVEAHSVATRVRRRRAA